ncbi:wax ester/triacylglycerol synthase family O-acyltransferase [Marinobacteraceae bacterium S3BR75-40.1]
MAPKATPMSAVDTSWLRMESPTNRMMISIVLVFESAIPLASFRRLLKERFLRFQRFRQRATKRGERYYWEDDPWFDLDNHLHVIALPGRNDQEELERLSSDLNSTPLDFSKPLWQIHYIDNYQGGCALFVRIHHCIADGISLVRVLLQLTDESPDSKVTEMRPSAKAVSPRPPYWKRLYAETKNTLLTARDQLNQAWQQVQNEPGYLRKLGREGLKIGEECLKLGLGPADPPTPLKGDLCGRKRVAWAPALSLDEVKATAKAMGGTVNDVLMSAATGALHTYLKQAGESLPDPGIHVAVPFNLRPLDQPIQNLGNQFGLVLVPLPVGTTCPRLRFSQVRQEMMRLKRSYQAQVTYSLLDLFGRGPDLLERRALELLSNKTSAVLTNVPGPRSTLYMCGARLTQPMFWVPQTGGVGVGMSIFSYDNTVQFGLISDKRLIDSPNDVVEEFIRSFHQLRDLALERINQRGELQERRAV